MCAIWYERTCVRLLLLLCNIFACSFCFRSACVKDARHFRVQKSFTRSACIVHPVELKPHFLLYLSYALFALCKYKVWFRFFNSIALNTRRQIATFRFVSFRCIESDRICNLLLHFYRRLWFCDEHQMQSQLVPSPTPHRSETDELCPCEWWNRNARGRPLAVQPFGRSKVIVFMHSNSTLNCDSRFQWHPSEANKFTYICG